MTPDGIPDSEWEAVEELTVTLIADAALGDANSDTAGRLTVLLADLETKYGPHPAIYVTRAEYIATEEEKESLLRTAYEAAAVRADTKYLVITSEALAGFFAEEREDLQSARHWLGVLEKHLMAFPPGSGAAQVERLRRLLDRG